ncbi:MAG: aldolase [Candidatus Acidiferrales bacterium]
MTEQFEPKAYDDLDPLLCQFKLPLQRTYYPFGFPVEIATNSEDVLIAADRNWRAFRRMFNTEPIRLRIGVLDTGPEMELVDPVLRSSGHLLMKVGTTNDFAVCDMNRRFAFCWISKATARNHAYVHTHYIDGLAMWPLHFRDLTPIHAACVVKNGTGLLFCGESEAGKSSLSYACARKGWTFVTDDLSELVRGWNTTAVLGNPHRVRLRESAAALFPELRQIPITVRANGERAIELYTAEHPNLNTAPLSRVDYILFLNRRSGVSATLAPLSGGKAMRWFEQILVLAERTDEQAKSLQRLLSAGILEFRYSDMDSAVAQLDCLVGAGRRPDCAPELSIGHLHG